jgi:YD repeat-containing protein
MSAFSVLALKEIIRSEQLFWKGEYMMKWLRIYFAASVAALMATSSFAGETYAYDALGRVTTVTHDNGTTVKYTYDVAGNRTAYAVNNPTLPAALVGLVVLPLNGFIIIPIPAH